VQTTHTPIPIAIVGLGFGNWIIEELLQPENRLLFQITALCDLDAQKAAVAAQKIGVKTATFEELLADPSLPAIGLFTGPAERASLVREAIRAGKHVMTTKPFERDPTAALDVLEEAARSGLAVHLNSPAPYLPPDLTLIRAWQHRHSLGLPLSAQFSTWVRYHEQADGRWFDNPDLCPVAPIFRLGIYLINDAVELFGEPDEVQVMTSRLFTGRPTPDHAQLSIRFKNGALVSILASFCVNDGDSYRNSMTLNFENGTVYRNAGAEGKSGVAGTLSLITVRNEKPSLVERIQLDSISGFYDWPAFHRAVCLKEMPPSDHPGKVAAGIRVIEAMARAEETGLPVKVR
jgi:predicted dehydrogenase